MSRAPPETPKGEAVQKGPTNDRESFQRSRKVKKGPERSKKVQFLGPWGLGVRFAMSRPHGLFPSQSQAAAPAGEVGGRQAGAQGPREAHGAFCLGFSRVVAQPFGLFWDVFGGFPPSFWWLFFLLSP